MAKIDLTKCTMLLTVVSLTVMKPGLMLIEAEPQVSCFFIFGDSYSDNGNNNELITTAKSNYLPYGIDFPDGPTGRFSNGKNIPDVLAQLMGFNKSVPPFVRAIRGSPNDIVRGVNHASGSSGIQDKTGIQFGDVFSMDDQLQNHNITIGRLARLGRNEDYLRQCLYVVNIGTNDYLNYYEPSNILTRLSTPPDRFAENLTEKFKKQLMQLYQLGARKAGVFGLGLLGCLPLELELYPTNGSRCVDMINDAVQLYNNRLKPLIDQLNNDLPGANFTYINTTSIVSTGDLSQVGITVANASCCKVLPVVGSCVPFSVPCTRSDRNAYAFYDNIHPTENFYSFIASRAYDAAQPSDAHPFDIKTLVGNIN